MKWTLAILAASGRVARGCWWWTMIRVRWALVCRQSRLSTRKPQDQKRLGMNGHSALDARAWQAPRLRRVRIRRHVVALTVRTRPGQTVIELEDAAERLAATFDAHAFRTHPHPRHPSSTLIIDMVMRDALTKVRTATEPEPSVACDVVRLGRTQRGGDWRLPIRGRHTLCVGASGAGKGSVLWGIACGLAPAAHADVVRLWGVDLKRGIELAMGERLFRTLAYTPEAALQVLKDLVDVIDERGALMVGKTRLHAPTVGDPLHVLVIDELAALTAYAPWMSAGRRTSCSERS